MKDKYSLGSKNPKKEIDIQVTPKRIFLAFLCLLTFVFMISQIILKYYPQEISLRCDDGTIEEVQFEKEFYCGEHYSVLYGVIENNRFYIIQDIIKGNICEIYANTTNVSINYPNEIYIFDRVTISKKELIKRCLNG